MIKEKVVTAIKKFWTWIKKWLWERPVSEPEPEKQYILKASDVAKEYIVVQYHGQRINLHRTLEYPVWKLTSRKDKRIIRNKFEKMEKDGDVKFETIDGHLICIRNLNYQARAEKAKEAHI